MCVSNFDPEYYEILMQVYIRSRRVKVFSPSVTQGHNGKILVYIL